VLEEKHEGKVRRDGRVENQIEEVQQVEDLPLGWASAHAYYAKARELFGEFARTNFNVLPISVRRGTLLGRAPAC
jgi:hypothetical protein